MPFNYGYPHFIAITEICNSPKWSPILGRQKRNLYVKPMSWYIETLSNIGFYVLAWETEYYHILEGENPVLEWVKGTALRPILQIISDPTAQKDFLEDLGKELKVAYPSKKFGTVFPFKRVFFIAKRVSN